MIRLAQHFSRHPSERHSEWLRQRQWFIKAKEQEEKRLEAEQQADDAFLGLAEAAIIATNNQIAEFEARMDAYEIKLNAYEARLDRYDAAVAQALIESVERLDLLEEQHRRLVERGFTAPNGQKVFKSEDGTFVVDQTGQPVGEEIVVPSTIPDGLPTAEQIIDLNDRIMAERENQQQLLEAQREIDEARDRIAEVRDKLDEGRDLLEQDEIAVSDIEKIEADLDAAMPTTLPSLPPSAMKLVSGVEADKAPSASTPFSGAVRDIPAMPTAAPVALPKAFELDS